MGLIDELNSLKKKYRLDASMSSMRAVGYRQVWEYLEGRYDKEALREKALAATRQLAKRQLTWLRAMDDVERFDCLRSDLSRAAGERVEDFLGGYSSP